MIRSKREFQPTAEHPLYLTARVRLPDVIGTWPAFWLGGGFGDGHIRPPWPPEIDISRAVSTAAGNNANMMWTGGADLAVRLGRRARRARSRDTYNRPQFDRQLATSAPVAAQRCGSRSPRVAPEQRLLVLTA